MTPEFSDAPPAAAHAAVEDLYAAAFGDDDYPAATITAAGTASITIDLDGPESALFRLVALSKFALALGDEEGPEVTPTMRYACGEVDGVFFLVQLAVTQAELDAELLDL